MKPTIENLQDSFGISRDVYKSSEIEGQEILDAYHNRQYTQDEIDILQERGQPVETFNIIKMFSNALEGYMESTIHDIQIKPRYMSNPTASLLLNDVVSYIIDENDFDSEGAKSVLDGIILGKMCVFYDIKDTGAIDPFGRKIKHLQIKHIPAQNCRIDPMSKEDDGSDSRFWITWKWVDEEEFKNRWGKQKLDKAESYSTKGTEDSMTEFERKYKMRFRGKFKEWNNYLVVHTVMRDGDTTWSVLWCNDQILEKKKIPFKKVQSPIRFVSMSRSDQAEHYGIFREVIESQRAINQAIIQIQLLVNTSKVFAEENAVEDVDDFKEQVNRVNEVVIIKDLMGIKVEDMSRDVLQQYTIIDRGLQRIKDVLGVNDSFLGQAFASDSGRKVNLQQNSSKSQMTPIVKRIKLFYKLVGKDIVNFVQQYYVSSQILRMSDKVNGDRYIALNQPLMMPTGEVDMYGQPIEQPVYYEDIDPDTGEVMEDEDGNIIMVPYNDPDTDIRFMDVDIKVEAVPYNNAAEQNQLLFETFLNGPVGQSVLQVNPAGYYKIAGMHISEFGTKSAPEIAKVLFETGQLVGEGQMDPSLAMSGGDTQSIMGGALGGSNGGGPRSQTLQIPTR